MYCGWSVVTLEKPTGGVIGFEAGRNPDELLDADDDLLARRAPARITDDPLARGKPFDTGAEAFNASGELCPR